MQIIFSITSKNPLKLKILLLTIALIGLSQTINAQKSHPDKFINRLKKDPSAVAITLPGWFVKAGGRIAARSADTEDAYFLKELTGSIKKLRFVVTQEESSSYAEELSLLKLHMEEKGYENLLNVSEEDTHIDLWAIYDQDKVKRMVVSILEDEDSHAFFNIKCDIDVDKLKSKEFYKEWESM